MERFHGVVIAGAGPVGLTAAVALAERGIPVRVYERGAQLSSESRASTFHPSSLELLKRLQVLDTVLERGLRVPSFQYRDRIGGLIAKFEYSALSEDTEYPFRVQFEQSKLTPVLMDRLNSFEDAEIRFSSEVVAAESVDDGALVQVSGPNQVEEVLASYVLGADGASSLVRKSAEIDFEGLTYPEKYLVVSTTFDFMQAMPDLSYVNYISDPREWFALLRTPDHWRATFPMGPDDDEEAAKDPAALQERLQGIYPVTAGYEIVHLNIYRVHRRVADTFNQGRIALAGDAAHVNNPLGGLGMNSGILDAYFFAQRLHLAWEGDDEERLLKEYGDLHRYLATDVIGKQSNLNWISLRETDATERKKQQDSLRELASDRERAREYLLKASLLTALRELEAATPGFHS